MARIQRGLGLKLKASAMAYLIVAWPKKSGQRERSIVVKWWPGEREWKGGGRGGGNTESKRRKERRARERREGGREIRRDGREREREGGRGRESENACLVASPKSPGALGSLKGCDYATDHVISDARDGSRNQ